MAGDRIGATCHRLCVLLMVAAVALSLGAVVASGQSSADETAVTQEPYQISLWSTFLAGGIVGMVIVLASLVATALIVENFLSIRQDRMIPPDLVETLQEHIQAKKYGDAQKACAEDGSFIAYVIGAGLSQVGSMFGFFDMQNAMQEVSEREVSKLYRKIEYLSFIASTAPLLGLLGTVTGMIATFNRIAQTEGTARPSQLAGGISEALVTTFEGLIVAIPAMFFVAFFRRRIDSFVAEAEAAVEKLMGQFRKSKG
jgi:biopolymer transport protein ExbB